MSKKRDDWGDLQEKMTHAIIREMRNDLDDILAGLYAGSLGYIDALKALKIQLLEGLNDPLVGAVEVRYRRVSISVDKISVPAARKKKKKSVKRPRKK